ncbi:MAG TPA: VCBS repeat-containing protein [Vicinamibacteria bacterium]|nr:VCBS repeat-containing protein [Vicinamibacteria bacterium]
MWRPLLVTFLALSLVSTSCRREEQQQDGAASGASVDFLEEIPIGEPPSSPPPWITNLEIHDLDGDGLLDVVLCDATLNQVRWIRQTAPGTFEERQVGSVVLAPAHVTQSGIDRDGDVDLLIAEMGQIYPSNAKIGAVNVFENTG